MEEENHEKYYILGSKVNNKESVVVTDIKKLSIICYDTFEMAKRSFKNAYDVLLAPSFTPSLPPSEEELHYHMEFMRLISFYPVIVELDRKTASNILEEWMDNSQEFYQTEEQYHKTELWHVPMRDGFLEKYGVLDIVRDIETTPFVGPNGKMVLRINKITQGTNNEDGSKRPTDEEIDEILRQRGYL